jgi:hypothetical protein
MKNDQRTNPQKAVDEIKEILEKYDLAAMVSVLDRTDMAFIRRIDPTWSCAWMEPVPDDPDGAVQVRMRSKWVEYPGDSEEEKKAAQKLQVEATTGMFIAFLNWLGETRDQMVQITAMLAKHYPQIMHSEKWTGGKW